MPAPGRRFSLLGREVTANFELRRIELAPGAVLSFRPADWRGCLVVVESGGIELETIDGPRARFAAGSVLGFEHIPIRQIRGCASELAIVSVVRRVRVR
jgi:quercetin dioxygenase-like cupin family protein